MVPLVATAQRFHQRPSALLAIADPVLALNFDLAAAAVLQRVEAREQEQ
jgi:hypothetical protein